MARLLALNTLIFLAPFAVYAGWLFATKRSVGTAADWTSRVLIILGSIGAVAVVIVLAVFVSFEGNSGGETYFPAQIIDGEIVPGRFGDE